MDSESKLKFEHTTRLDKLYQFLNYEIQSTFLVLLLWIPFMFLFVIGSLILAAILFTPFMLFVLYKEERIGWIITFVLSVIFPLVLLVIFAKQLFFLFMIPFYFYCFVLRMVVKDWIQEKNAKYELQMQMQESKKKNEEENDLNFFIQK